MGRSDSRRPCNHELVMNQLRIRAEATLNGAGALTPEVDGTSLIMLVGSYEATRGYDPAGEYGGLVPEHFDFGNVSRYYLGTEANQWPKLGEAWLLGCQCGEVGCWPLAVRITVDSSNVIWSNFAQPHRPSWDYGAFGPFKFDRRQYAKAIANGIARLRDATQPFS